MNRNVKSLVRHCSETLDSEEIDSMITQLGFVLQDRHEVEMEEALLHEYYLAMQAEDDEMMLQWEH
jgi:hypothetical protein